MFSENEIIGLVAKGEGGYRQMDITACRHELTDIDNPPKASRETC